MRGARRRPRARQAIAYNGVAADITTTPATAFLPVVASGVLIAMVGAMLKTGRAEHA